MIRARSALRTAAVLTSVVLLVACGGTQFADQPFTAVARLSGLVCGSEMVGTAVVIRDELLVTAAHNVAGADGPLTITFSDATTHQAVVVGFDIHRDIAFLSTPGMHRLPIRMANPQQGATGKILRLRGPIAEEAVRYSRAEIVTAVGAARGAKRFFAAAWLALPSAVILGPVFLIPARFGGLDTERLSVQLTTILLLVVALTAAQTQRGRPGPVRTALVVIPLTFGPLWFIGVHLGFFSGGFWSIGSSGIAGRLALLAVAAVATALTYRASPRGGYPHR